MPSSPRPVVRQFSHCPVISVIYITLVSGGGGRNNEYFQAYNCYTISCKYLTATWQYLIKKISGSSRQVPKKLLLARKVNILKSSTIIEAHLAAPLQILDMPLEISQAIAGTGYTFRIKNSIHATTESLFIPNPTIQAKLIYNNRTS